MRSQVLADLLKYVVEKAALYDCGGTGAVSGSAVPRMKVILTAVAIFSGALGNVATHANTAV